MNTIYLSVNFEKGTIRKKGISLVTGDFNSTKLVFEFDRQDGTKMFEMCNTSGEILFFDEIVNNEIILNAKIDILDINGYIKYMDNEGYDYWYDADNEILYDNSYNTVTGKTVEELTKQQKNASLFSEAGKYPFEISLYKDDSKLTSASSNLKVKESQVIIDEEAVKMYLPYIDDLMDNIKRAINESQNLNLEVEKNNRIATITLTKKNGTTKEVKVYDGEKGDTPVIQVGTTTTLSPNSSATVTQTGTDLRPIFNFGIPKGNTGDSGVYIGESAPTDPVKNVWIIPNGTEETSVLRIKNASGNFIEIKTIKGEQGIQGVQGIQGIQGIQGVKGDTPSVQVGTTTTLPPNSDATVTRTGTDLIPVFNFGIPKGEKGDKGDKGDTGDIGPAVPVDDYISDLSENAVKSRVVKQYIDSILGNINSVLATVVEGVQTNE